MQKDQQAMHNDHKEMQKLLIIFIVVFIFNAETKAVVRQ